MSFPIKNGDFPQQHVSLPEGSRGNHHHIPIIYPSFYHHYLNHHYIYYNYILSYCWLMLIVYLLAQRPSSQARGQVCPSHGRKCDGQLGHFGGAAGEVFARRGPRTLFIDRQIDRYSISYRYCRLYYDIYLIQIYVYSILDISLYIVYDIRQYNII